MVGAGDSHRSQMAKLSPFKSSCRQGQTIFERGTVKNSFNKVTRNVESCAYETNAENQNKCRQEADQAARDWNTLNMALGHWKAVADAMDHLRFVMESIVQKGGRCCFEGGAGQACKEDCDTWNEWRSKFQDISDAAERLKTNHDILKGPSCAAKPAVPWALAQTSTSCPDKFHCNYGYMAVACREKCPNGMAQLWHGKGTNKVSKYVEQNCAKEVHMHKQSAGWKYATKTSIANNGQMTAPDAGQEKTDFRFWCSSGLCGTRARHLSLCAQRNYCVEQPCLNFFTDDKAWTVWWWILEPPRCLVFQSQRTSLSGAEIWSFCAGVKKFYFSFPVWGRTETTGKLKDWHQIIANRAVFSKSLTQWMSSSSILKIFDARTKRRPPSSSPFQFEDGLWTKWNERCILRIRICCC